MVKLKVESMNQKGFVQIPILIAIIVGVLVVGGGGYFGYTQLKNNSTEQPSEEDLKITELERQIVELGRQSNQSNDIESLKEEIAALRVKTAKTELTNTEIIDKVKPAVVYIKTADGSSGSGMIIESDGYILTNAHVVDGVKVADITTNDKKIYKASVTGRDEVVDLAMLKIIGSSFPTVEFGNSDENVLRQGDKVIALGFPLGLEDGGAKFAEGTISGRQTYQGKTYLETDVQIKPGNSGGPLVNKFGQVVGVNSRRYFGETMKEVYINEPIKWAIPINTVKVYITSLKVGDNTEDRTVAESSILGSSSITVNLSLATPSSGNIIKGISNSLASFSFCASSQKVIINKIDITINGVFEDSDIDYISFDFQDGKPPFVSSINSSTHKVSGLPSNGSWIIAANSCRSVIVKVKPFEYARVFQTILASIASANDISTSANVYGDFPIRGNVMTFMSGAK